MSTNAASEIVDIPPIAIEEPEQVDKTRAQQRAQQHAGSKTSWNYQGGHGTYDWRGNPIPPGRKVIGADVLPVGASRLHESDGTYTAHGDLVVPQRAPKAAADDTPAQPEQQARAADP